jgi:hypothetical protein
MEWNEVTACNFCGGPASALYMRSHVPNWYQGKPLELYQCEGCGLVRASPRPDPRALYRNYLAGTDKVREITMRKLERPNVLLHHRRAIEDAMGFARRAVHSLYDMGCGAGTVMMEARRLGLEAEGNDLNRASIDMLVADGFKARCGFTRELEFDRGYDVVMNLDYLEHSYEPFDDLKTSHRILNQGGVLYLKTLYLGCPNHLLDGEHWNLFGNGHFHFFHPDTLKAMVREAGFSIVSCKTAALITIAAVK